MNKGVLTALLSIMLAQGLKIPLHYVKKKEWKPSLFFQTGGMPSSHSAGVASLTTFIALKKGVKTVDFALSFIFGLIVMYDAQGIRRQTGELTLKVNSLDELVRKAHEKESVEFEEKKPKRLKEMLGHQPQEVVGGALLGLIMGTLGFLLSKKDRQKKRFFVR
ncbi:divergent PAP2 family protein [Rossellomorea aquimaris]|uniref:divergent PAP2 family protein n=1 Tax=Rossellomorea aquimaris TaxID=189382 RepID=UPI001CD5C69D|nr:divergent PAP2 family protein [Rossellomorea aquimaris]MCA1054574.1 divergent PAP2 family protein [Rossellomorea aquimaris]